MRRSTFSSCSPSFTCKWEKEQGKGGCSPRSHHPPRFASSPPRSPHPQPICLIPTTSCHRHVHRRWVHWVGFAIVGFILLSLGWHCHGWLLFIVVGLESCPLGWNCRQWVEFAVVGLNLPSLGWICCAWAPNRCCLVGFTLTALHSPLLAHSLPVIPVAGVGLLCEGGGNQWDGKKKNKQKKNESWLLLWPVFRDAEERGLCYGVKRGKESRSGTSQNPQTPTPNLTPTKNNKSHVL